MATLSVMAPLWRRRPPDEPADETLVIDDPPRLAGEVVEEEVAPPPPRIWPWLLALLLLVLAGLAAWWLLTRDDDRTTVPEVIGMTEADARTRLAENDLEADVDRRPNERPEGVVFAQTPGAGTQVAEGETVELAVSSGAPPAPVPSVIGLREDEAVRTLENAGFEVKVQRVFAGAPPGEVVEQEPRGGTEAARGSVVQLKVSKGRNLNRVPDVVGRTEDEAVRILRQREFEPRIFDVPSEEPEGTVVSQDPPAGEQAPPDSRVRINVSTGEASGETTERPAETATTETATETTAATVNVPNVVGVAQTPALRRLRNAGLRGVVAYRTSDQPPGRVIEQRPASGATANRNAQVQIVVASGANAEPLDVPDVRGNDEDAARQTLEDAGFRVEVINVGNGTTVQDQQPRPGVTSYRGAVVTLFVG